MDTHQAAARRIALVLNHHAGAVLADGQAPRKLADALAASGADIVEPPDGDLPARMAEAARLAPIVVVAGGDGSVACAAAALAGGDTRLGIIPAGTMNLLARDLNLPVGDPEAAIRIILAGQARRIDVGEAAGNAFLCACMIGAPARLGRYREAARSLGAWRQWPRFARALLRVLTRGRTHHLRLTVDGVPHRIRTRALTITLGALSDATGHAFGRAALDTGTLTAYAVRQHGIADLARAFWRLARGQPRDASLQVLHGASMELIGRSPALHIMVDGEGMLLPAPVRFTVRPRALTVLAP